MNENEISIVYTLLKSEINRMFITKDADDLENMYGFAQDRLERIYKYHYARLHPDE